MRKAFMKQPLEETKNCGRKSWMLPSNQEDFGKLASSVLSTLMLIYNAHLLFMGLFCSSPLHTATALVGLIAFTALLVFTNMRRPCLLVLYTVVAGLGCVALTAAIMTLGGLWGDGQRAVRMGFVHPFVALGFALSDVLAGCWCAFFLTDGEEKKREKRDDYFELA